MAPKLRLLLAGAAFIVLALFGLLALTTAYWPFQSVVQVIAPFLVLSILASVGVSLMLVALLLPLPTARTTDRAETTSAIDSLLSEVGRRR